MKPIVLENAPNHIIVKMSNKPVILPTEIRNQHNLYWEEQIKNNPTLHNGDSFAITEIEHTPEKLVITVTKTDYKHYLYTLRHADCAYPCQVLYTCAAVITNDQHIVIGRMNPLTSTPDRLQFTGGGLEESDFDGEKFTLEKNISTEIKEEMGLDIYSSSVISFHPKFIKHKGSHDFWAVIYEITVDYTVQGLHTLFLSHNQQLIERGERPEFADLLFLPLEKEAIQTFIKNEKSPMVDYLVRFF
ncbi:NUDIX hydrolase [Bacillus sp. Bva_UNVM-123]|uniref:hypothetical protein n=1 Tax=Bacillus sp. Bva_UNVM-123 TaxID=2829798 RepID=UPI00391F5F69